MIVVGFLFPQGHTLSDLIRPILMLMLLFTFVQLDLSRSSLQKNHFFILLANIIIPLGWFYVIPADYGLLKSAILVICMAPTAVASPVLAGFMNRRTDFVAMSVILTSIPIALLMPFQLKQMGMVSTASSPFNILWSILTLVMAPFIVSRLIRHYLPRVKAWFVQYNQLNFLLFLINVYLAAAKSAHAFHEQGEAGMQFLPGLALGIVLAGSVNFAVGYLIGRKAFGLEGSLSLGRKNTMFAMWVALTFMDPITALGPMAYIVYQNTVNSIQIFWTKQQDLKVRASR